MIVFCTALVFCFSGVSAAKLTSTFYDAKCPKALSIINATVAQALANETRMGASLLRLFFHDCFVKGCDGSVLLDDTANFTGEKGAAPNFNSLRGFDVIDNIKSQIESACSGVVSCADIVAVAARDSVVQLGGRTWQVLLGRRDATTASINAANRNLPGPSSSLRNLISAFKAQGMNATDMVTLSGAHTIGQSRCIFYRFRIYSETNIDQNFATSLQANCSSNSGPTDNNLAFLDVKTPTLFDNSYYQDLRNFEGLFHSDQELFNNGSADAQVTKYSADQNTFFNDFAAAMIKLGNIKPLTGKKGEIRKNCRLIN
ncbi:hypothetical protein SUGI_0236870 [Cryptomeria japonica]|nr:hypothetical protein SUGI_0236870 [Cryptomeria japonica]